MPASARGERKRVSSRRARERGQASSPLGTIEVTVEDGFLVAAGFPDLESRGGLPQTDGATRFAEALAESAAGRPASGIPSLRPVGTPFQREVWEAIRTIPTGETVTYSELARRLGRPGAARAVASACAANRIALAIPCHRVVRSDGSPGGYRWGIDRKVALLESERPG